jgi:GntR family transcriptional regulator
MPGSSAEPGSPVPPRRLPQEPGVPLWQQVHRDVLRRIGSGEFADDFPGELELAEAYGVSRHTVREALRRIRDAGLLDTSRGRATRVRPRAIEQPLGGLYSLFREVEARGQEQRSDVLSIGILTDPVAAEALGLEGDAELFFLERLRRADGEPLAHDRVWLPADIGRPMLDADFTRAALYDELVRRSGVRPTGGSERISAVVPTAEQQALLEVGPETGCFAIERRGRVRDQDPIEYRLSLVRGDRYSLLTSWTPSGVYLGPPGVPPVNKR